MLQLDTCLSHLCKFPLEKAEKGARERGHLDVCAYHLQLLCDAKVHATLGNLLHVYANDFSSCVV